MSYRKYKQSRDGIEFDGNGYELLWYSLRQYSINQEANEHFKIIIAASSQYSETNLIDPFNYRSILQSIHQWRTDNKQWWDLFKSEYKKEKALRNLQKSMEVCKRMLYALAVYKNNVEIDDLSYPFTIGAYNAHCRSHCLKIIKLFWR